MNDGNVFFLIFNHITDIVRITRAIIVVRDQLDTNTVYLQQKFRILYINSGVNVNDVYA